MKTNIKQQQEIAKDTLVEFRNALLFKLIFAQYSLLFLPFLPSTLSAV
jgi:hypothetical protein